MTAPYPEISSTDLAVNSRKRKLSTSKKLVFSAVITLLFFGALELVLGLIGVKPAAATEDPYVGFAGYSPLFTESVDDQGQPEYMTARNKLRWFNRQTFPVKKAAGTYRVFTLGGSTTYGHPYDDKTSFSGWMRELLPEVDKTHKFEVINCGGISYASYRAASLMEELLNYEPDLFVIYSGHNEFLEARTYGQLKQTPGIILQLGSLASRTRTFTAIKNLASQATQAKKTTPENTASANQLSAEVNTLLDSAVGPDVYHRDDEQRQHIFDHYAYNMRRMIEMARKHGAKVILVTPASNIGQCSPFKSENDSKLLGAKLLEWQHAYAAAQDFYRAGKYAEAVYPINLCVELNGRHADTLYLRARIFEALGQWERAQADYLKARDEDVCTLRAPTEIIDAVRKISQAESVPLIDFVKWTEENSPHSIPGDQLFLDHVHGTIDAYKQIAMQVIDAMVQQKMITASTSGTTPSVLSAEMIAAASARVLNGIDSEAHGTALRNISKVYSWAGKKEDADRVALRALELIPNDPDTVYQAGNALVRMGQVDEGIRLYNRILELKPDYAAQAHASLGFAYALKGDEEKCIEHYKKTLQLNPNFADIHYNLATILEKHGELTEAVIHYRAAIAGNAFHYQAHYRLGVTLGLMKEWEAAKQEYLEAAKINPSAAEPHLGLAEALTALGDAPGARAQYQWVAERYPMSAQATEALKKLP